MGKITNCIRKINWGILVVCFFLPFTKGCFAVIETPYKTAFDDFASFLFAGVPFLYPLLFLLGVYIFYLIRNEQRKNLIAKILYFILFYGITFLAIFTINALYDEYLNNQYLNFGNIFSIPLAVVIVILWGIMGLAYKRLLTKNILTMIAFQISTLSGCWIGYAFYIGEKRLIGAWLSVIASVFIFITYVFDYLKGRRCPANFKRFMGTDEYSNFGM